eukprot:7660732-Karenia_brevis.AAC.1
MQILDTAASNSRARTVRMRVRVCKKICDWMYATFGHPVPRRAVDLVDFLHDQLEARPLKTCLLYTSPSPRDTERS